MKASTTFKVVNEYPVFCQITDGIIGSDEQVIGEYSTLKDAQDALAKWHEQNEEEGYGLPFEAGSSMIREITLKDRTYFKRTYAKLTATIWIGDYTKADCALALNDYHGEISGLDEDEEQEREEQVRTLWSGSQDVDDLIGDYLSEGNACEVNIEAEDWLEWCIGAIGI